MQEIKQTFATTSKYYATNDGRILRKNDNNPNYILVAHDAKRYFVKKNMIIVLAKGYVIFATAAGRFIAKHDRNVVIRGENVFHFDYAANKYRFNNTLTTIDSKYGATKCAIEGETLHC